MKKKKTPVLCPCGSHLDYRDCCGRFHEGALAPDALALMQHKKISAVIVVDEHHQVVGAFNMHDLLQAGLI